MDQLVLTYGSLGPIGPQKKHHQCRSQRSEMKPVASQHSRAEFGVQPLDSSVGNAKLNRSHDPIFTSTLGILRPDESRHLGS